MDAGRDDGDLSRLRCRVEGGREVGGGSSTPGTVRKDGRGPWGQRGGQVCRARWLIGCGKLGVGLSLGLGRGLWSGSRSSCRLALGR